MRKLRRSRPIQVQIGTFSFLLKKELQSIGQQSRLGNNREHENFKFTSRQQI